MSDDAGTLGEQFARRLAAKDRDGLVALFADGVDFRALTPGKFWEASEPAQIVDDIVLGRWFEPTDEIESLESVDTGAVVDRGRVAYRLKVRNADGLHLVEQQAYLDASDGRITWLRILCSGYQPLPASQVSMR